VPVFVSCRCPARAVDTVSVPVLVRTAGVLTGEAGDLSGLLPDGLGAVVSNVWNARSGRERGPVVREAAPKM